MNSLISIVHIGNTVCRLEKTGNIISFSSDLEQKQLKLDDFFQISSVILHASKELEYINKFYPNNSIMLREDIIGEDSLRIKYNELKEIDIVTNKWSISINQQQFKTLVDDLYNAINSKNKHFLLHPTGGHIVPQIDSKFTKKFNKRIIEHFAE